MPVPPSEAGALRQRLAAARVMLVFSPELCPAALDALDAALPFLDVVQVRPKAGADAAPGARPLVSEARATYDWSLAVLERIAASPHYPLVLVNDRVDVAAALAGRGVHGVHLGEDDCPPEVAREVLGAAALIGLSTHDMAGVAAADDQPVDYLGFGPIHATTTKGYVRGLGPERAWVVDAAAGVPVFAIGGIDAARAADLRQLGRVAVGSAILCAHDPGAAAEAVRQALE